MSFETVALRPARLLLPDASVSPETWACLACDQYTSQPEYWARAAALVGDAPSTLHLMLPECDLKDSAVRVPRIHAAMRDYCARGLLRPAVENGFVLCERTTPSGTRLGLVAAIDLEAYDYAPGSLTLVRPTEQTIPSRLPPRLAIRRGAPLELSHILILIDDPARTVLEPLRAKKASLRKLYDFDLMLGGGHLAGWAVESGTDLAHLDETLNALRLSLGEHPMLLAVGDGNHSLATARAYWNELRESLSPEERRTHPARFAMAEIENLHDEALLFEPIHRLLTGVDPEALFRDWQTYAAARGMALADSGETHPAVPGRPAALSGKSGEPAAEHAFRMITAAGERSLTVQNPEGAIPCETIQLFLDAWLSAHPGASIDYIHGEASLRSLAVKDGASAGFLLPDIDKSSFFADVRRLGVLPRKTFSMGEADEKRFYMECRAIAL